MLDFRELFHAAFMSVWTDLDESQQTDLDENLKIALDSSNHTDIVQTVLNLAEFMDHSEKVCFCSHLFHLPRTLFIEIIVLGSFTYWYCEAQSLC